MTARAGRVRAPVSSPSTLSLLGSLPDMDKNDVLAAKLG
jgi:hypothetical protein